MISVIMCSTEPSKFAAAGAMYQAAMGGHPWELIGIHDAKSLAEGYNRGVAESHGDIVVFSHDDVEVLSDDLPGRLVGHLQMFDLIGVVGTSHLTGPRWVSAGPSRIFGQVCHVHPRGELVVDIYGVPRRAVGNIMALDGLFLAGRRAVVEKIPFDAVTFDGFHLYDIDFSFRAFQAGLRLAVVSDINLLHRSGGAFDEVWKVYAERFIAKWRAVLPPRRLNNYQLGGVMVRSREEAIAVMNPAYVREAT